MQKVMEKGAVGELSCPDNLPRFSTDALMSRMVRV